MPLRLLAVLVLAVAALATAPAAHAFRLPAVLGPQANNPADALAHLPVDDLRYDAPRRCDPKPKPGVVPLTR